MACNIESDESGPAGSSVGFESGSGGLALAQLASACTVERENISRAALVLQRNGLPCTREGLALGLRSATAEVAVDEPIVFSYSLTIKHSDKTWVTRMDQYLNYGLPVAHWESFAVSIAIMIGVSLVVCCMFASILNKDFRILNQLRTTYRERSQQIRRRVRSVAYSTVAD